MKAQLMRQRLGEVEVACLATITKRGRPHVVPCCFVLVGNVVYTAVDAKPKSTTSLRRIENITTHPEATLLVHHYDHDWSRLWWIRLDGSGRIVPGSDERDLAIEHLTAKYPQYRHMPISGRVIGIDVHTWRSWP
jgi:PPOX class probable F420-dependent enzyme